MIPGLGLANILFQEDFDSYNSGSIDGQPGLGLGMEGNWEQTGDAGDFTLAPGLSGGNGLFIRSTGNSNLYISHTVPDWGSGKLWMSYLYNELSYGGHFYVSGGDNFSGAVGHAWTNSWGINNVGEGVAYAPKTTYRVVALLDWDAGTTTMWVDPDPNTVPILDSSSPEFNAVAFKEEAQGANARFRIGSWCSGLIDDIRIGTEYEDVAIAYAEDLAVAPFVDAPLDEESNILLDTSLAWIPNGAVTYDVYLWKEGDPVPESPNGTTGSYSFQPGGLEAGTLYYWRVDSTNGAGTSTGEVWSFVTGDGVDAILPPDGAERVPLDLPLEWSSSDAETYDLYLWKEGEERPASPVATVAEEGYQYPAFEADTTYHWEVVSNYSSGSPTTSLQWSFTTGSGVPGELFLHEEFEGYASGSLIGQLGKGIGLDGTAAWEYQGNAGTFEIGPGLSGLQGVIATADGTGDLDARIGHTVENWGEGVFYLSYLYNEIEYGGHSYVSAGGSYSGALGHAWTSNFGINNEEGPSFQPYTQEQTYRIVARIDFTANKTTMWVDPQYEFDSPTVVKQEVMSSTPRLIFRFYGTDAVIDDVRIGSDFQSVVEEIEVLGQRPQLQIARVGAELKLTWNNESGMLYDLLASEDLSLPTSDWAAVAEEFVGLAADESGVNEVSLSLPSEERTFYVVRAYQPPPTVLFSSDFESDNGGFEAVDLSGGAGTTWMWGMPDSDNGYGSVVSGGAESSQSSWALGLGAASEGGDSGYYNDSTDAALRLSVDLTAVTQATLRYSQALDLDGSDSASINFLDADAGNAVLGTFAVLDSDTAISPWENREIPIPAAAIGKNVIIEWKLTTAGFASEYIGWYIDNVSVTAP
ncbi:hypothetical protein [Roseibacillus ishigakijimensis]|uniref:Fibronectin type-III domain-containing protein n=1 Tax=Roseibacillus ishigakijimensis TaxID=454146 RepID=A0A934RRK6_9BACT|nr:hypothetical protein [Roseibacillus ishigakijimensis]MBK1833739.1 hypothetical protein [Roseibacillus ishigakijimensis]